MLDIQSNERVHLPDNVKLGKQVTSCNISYIQSSDIVGPLQGLLTGPRLSEK